MRSSRYFSGSCFVNALRRPSSAEPFDVWSGALHGRAAWVSAVTVVGRARTRARICSRQNPSIVSFDRARNSRRPSDRGHPARRARPPCRRRTKMPRRRGLLHRLLDRTFSTRLTDEADDRARGRSERRSRNVANSAVANYNLPSSTAFQFNNGPIHCRPIPHVDALLTKARHDRQAALPRRIT